MFVEESRLLPRVKLPPFFLTIGSFGKKQFKSKEGKNLISSESWKETNERSVRIIFEMKVSIVRVRQLSKIGPIQRKPS